LLRYLFLFLFRLYLSIHLLPLWRRPTPTFNDRVNRVFNNQLWAYQLLASAHSFMAGLLAICFGCLFSFHVFLLLVMRMSTFDYLLYRRGFTKSPENSDKIRSDDYLEAQRQQEREKWQRAMLERRLGALTSEEVERESSLSLTHGPSAAVQGVISVVNNSPTDSSAQKSIVLEGLSSSSSSSSVALSGVLWQSSQKLKKTSVIPV
jgi:hypothetical protein